MHYTLYLLISGLLLFSCPPKEVVHEQHKEDKLHLNGPAEFDFWIQTPLHPGTGEAIAFKTSVGDAAGIEKIELFILEYELYKDKDGLPSKRKRKKGLWEVVKTWDFSSPRDQVALTYRHAEGFADHTNIEYVFRIYNVKGQVTDRLAQFDAGKSPWSKDKVLLYSTTRGKMSERINLCFLRDVDYGNNNPNRLLLNDLEDMIYKGFHQNNMIKDHKDKWAFYYTNHELSGPQLLNDSSNSAIFPAFLKQNTIKGIDAFGLIHTTPYTDRTLMAREGVFLKNNLFSSENVGFGTAVHEAAHAIFRLSDEYNQCNCFENKGGSNVFLSKTACEDFMRKHGFDGEGCEEITAHDKSKWYTPERKTEFESANECLAFVRANGYPDDDCEAFRENGKIFYGAYTATCIMRDDGNEEVKNFQRGCAAVIEDYYRRMDKYSTPIATTSIPFELAEYVPNYNGYEKTVLLEVKQDEVLMNVKVAKVEYGVPTKNFLVNRDLKVDVRTTEGTTNYSISMDNPDKVHVHGHSHETDNMHKCGQATTWVSVPFDETISNVVCDRAIYPGDNGTKSTSYEDLPSVSQFFDVQNDFVQACEAFEQKELEKK